MGTDINAMQVRARMLLGSVLYWLPQHMVQRNVVCMFLSSPAAYHEQFEQQLSVSERMAMLSAAWLHAGRCTIAHLPGHLLRRWIGCHCHKATGHGVCAVLQTTEVACCWQAMHNAI